MDKPKKTPHSLLTALVALCAVAGGAQAQDLIFNSPTGSITTISSSTNASRLFVGVDEPNNHVFVDAGGRVDLSLLADIGQQSPATNSLLSVQNGGLVVIGAADTNNLPASGILVGDTAGNGQLIVNHDSEIITDDLIVGAGQDETGMVSAQNGGVLEIYGALAVGATNNMNNVVSINDGGSVVVNDSSDIEIKNIDGATENLNELNIASGGALKIRGDVHAPDLIAKDGLNFSSGSTLGVGGELTTANNTIDDGLTVSLDDTLSTNHNARWNASSIDVGSDTANNALLVENGAEVNSAGLVYVGFRETATDNTLTVTGSNSTFTSTADASVGVLGSRNTMDVLDGASAQLDQDLNIGASASASQNTVTVDGTNSTLSIGGELYVGASGTDNTMTVSDAAAVDVTGAAFVGEKGPGNKLAINGADMTVGTDLILGVAESSSGDTIRGTTDTRGNMVSVRDGATLDIAQDLTVGKNGRGSILAIRDESIVNVNGSATIGENSGDNYIFLEQGSNAQFNVTGDLTVGSDGDAGDNRFAVYGGTADIGGDLLLGANTNQHDLTNYIHLETTNATLNVTQAIHVGANSSDNTLTATKGAAATAQDIYVGAYAGTSNNIMTVSGDGSHVTALGVLTIGSTNSGGNSVVVNSGGVLEVADRSGIIFGSTNDTLAIESDGVLKTTDWDISMIDSNLTFSTGAGLWLTGTFSGTNEIENGFNLTLDGAGSSWTSSNDLFVGSTTDNNSLTITNGAKATALKNFYMGDLSRDNVVTLSGAGSTLDVTENLYIGSEDTDSAFNTLRLTNGANVVVGGDAFLYRRALLSIDSKSQVNVAGGYNQDEFSSLEVGISSNQANPNLVVGGTAAFSSSDDPDENSIIQVFNEGVGESNIIAIVQADKITLDGTQATGGSFESNIASNALLGFTVTITNDVDHYFIVLSDFIERSIGEAGGLQGQLLEVSMEIEDLADGGNSNAIEQVNIISQLQPEQIAPVMDSYYGAKASSAPANYIISLGVQNVADQLTMRADNTRARMGGATAQIDWNKPEGVAAPHEAGQELQAWVTAYGSRGSKSATEGFKSYDTSLSGFMVGADMSVAEGILVGVSGGSGSASADSGNGAQTDTKSVYAALYSSFGTKSWFADAGLIYAGSSIDSVYGTTFDTRGEYDAKNIAVNIGGGKEIAGRYLIWTPQLYLLGNYYNQDAYQETASNAVGRDVDGFSTLYLKSTLGTSMGMYMGMGDVTLKPELRAFWQHEWNAREEELGYRLIGGSNNYTLFSQAPEQDLLQLGIGTSAKIGEYLELRADLDTRLGGSYRDYTLLGSIRYQF